MNQKPKLTIGIKAEIFQKYHLRKDRLSVKPGTVFLFKKGVFFYDFCCSIVKKIVGSTAKTARSTNNSISSLIYNLLLTYILNQLGI